MNARIRSLAFAAFAVAGAGLPANAQQLDRLADFENYFIRCFNLPPQLGGSVRAGVTVRFSLRKDGSLIGEPQVTFTGPPRDSEGGRALANAARQAIVRCTPVSLTPAFGGAIAGRPMTVRFFVAGDRALSETRFQHAWSPAAPVVPESPRGLAKGRHDPDSRYLRSAHPRPPRLPR